MISGILFYSCIILSLQQIGRNIATQCQDDKTLDCAKLDKIFDICKDIHDAKLVCRSFCNLCKLVDGNWADWAHWSSCDVTCGNGKQTRIRTCTNPAPAFKGLDCKGKRIDTEKCYQSLCPVHGGWSTWSYWNACPVTCGFGIQKQYRNCSNPYPLRFGDHCFGDPVDFRNCFKKPCEDGVWGNWESWGKSSPYCDSGVLQRSRSCTHLVGIICKGKSFDVRQCNKQDCCYITTHGYTGTWHRTQSGKECQRWDEQTPHKHSNNQDIKFDSDGSVSAARKFCRDPGSSGFLWCYSTDRNVRWEKCGIPKC